MLNDEADFVRLLPRSDDKFVVALMRYNRPQDTYEPVRMSKPMWHDRAVIEAGEWATYHQVEFRP